MDRRVRGNSENKVRPGHNLRFRTRPKTLEPSLTPLYGLSVYNSSHGVVDSE